MGGSLMETANIRLYGGGGPAFIFSCNDEKKVLYGGGGFFGFEFYQSAVPSGFSYFIELGATGFSSVSSMSGFTAKTGFRYCIPIKNKIAQAE